MEVHSSNKVDSINGTEITKLFGVQFTRPFEVYLVRASDILIIVSGNYNNFSKYARKELEDLVLSISKL